MSGSQVSILLIEDDPDDVVLIRDMLGQEPGFDPECANTLSSGLDRLRRDGADVVLLDLGLPESTGLETFAEVRRHAPYVPIVVLTGHDDERMALRAVRQGAQDYLVKSRASGDLLKRAIRYAIERSGAEARLVLEARVLARLNLPYLDMPAMDQVLALIRDSLSITGVGIRLLREGEWPFHAWVGLPEGFLERASRIGAQDGDGRPVLDGEGEPMLRCLCGDVLSGRIDESMPYFTAGGSFCARSAEEFRQAAARATVGPCGLCCAEVDPESVAIVPVRSERETVGLIYLFDDSEERFTPALMRSLERIGTSIGIALARQRAEDALRQYATRVQVMREVDEAILSARSLGEIARAALRQVPRLMSCSRASVVSFDPRGGTDRVLAVHQEGGRGPRAGARLPGEVFGDVSDLRAGGIRLVRDSDTFDGPPQLLRLLQEGGIRSAMSVPLICEGELIGCLNIGRREPGAYSAEDQTVARELAGVLAVALGEARSRMQKAKAETALGRVRHEMEIARDIQQRLYPAGAPRTPGLQVGGASYPAELAGGDYFDFFPMPDGHVGVGIGDAVGHGVGAALIMASMRAYVRSFGQVSSDVTEILTRANRLLVAETADDVFCTLALLHVDPEARTVVCVNASQPEGLLLDPTGGIRDVFDSTCFPLGLLPGADYDRVRRAVLRPGELLAFYTDGVLDARSPSDVRFGRGRIVAALREHLRRPARQAAQAICKAVRAHCAPALPDDDITVVVIKAGDEAR